MWPKLLLYFLAGVVFGVTAYLTNSILPGIAIHIMGDLTFFTPVWPHHTARRPVWQRWRGQMVLDQLRDQSLGGAFLALPVFFARSFFIFTSSTWSSFKSEASSRCEMRMNGLAPRPEGE